MNHNPKPNQLTPDDIGEFDVDMLLSKAGTILAREIRALMAASARGKLDRADSQDLVSYIKLLADTKLQLEDATKNMTDEQLKKAASK